MRLWISTCCILLSALEVLVPPVKTSWRSFLPWSVSLVVARVTMCTDRGTGCVHSGWCCGGKPGLCNDPSCAAGLGWRLSETVVGLSRTTHPAPGGSFSTFFHPWPISYDAVGSVPSCPRDLPLTKALLSSHPYFFLWDGPNFYWDPCPPVVWSLGEVGIWPQKRSQWLRCCSRPGERSKCTTIVSPDTRWKLMMLGPNWWCASNLKWGWL